MDRSSEAVLKQLQRVVNKILFLKKRSLLQFDGTDFFPSEIHLLVAITGSRATNATKIAGELGVTKGAVSQTLTRLEKKGVLVKTRDPYNKNELTLELTAFGQEAYRHYQDLAAQLNAIHERYLESFSKSEKKAIERFLVEVEQVFGQLE